jgi:hypothetical protein
VRAAVRIVGAEGEGLGLIWCAVPGVLIIIRKTNASLTYNILLTFGPGVSSQKACLDGRRVTKAGAELKLGPSAFQKAPKLERDHRSTVADAHEPLLSE